MNRVEVVRPDQYPMQPDAEYALICEQSEYLEGVLWSDKELRCNRDVDAGKDIDPWGTQTKAFWRGVLETAGHVRMSVSRDCKYPRIELSGTHSFLRKFLDFLQYELHDSRGIRHAWDDAGRLEFQALGEYLLFTGSRAQEVCRLLYVGQSVGRASVRATVDHILNWTGK